MADDIQDFADIQSRIDAVVTHELRDLGVTRKMMEKALKRLLERFCRDEMFFNMVCGTAMEMANPSVDVLNLFRSAFMGAFTLGWCACERQAARDGANAAKEGS